MLLLWKRNGESDCLKTFDSYLSLIIAIGNIFTQSNMSMDNVSVEYLILMRKVLIFKMRVPLLGFSLCKANETLLNEMICSIWKQHWFIHRIKFL